MKKIAILGAGIYNIPVFQILKEAGYYLIAIDGNENAPAKDGADKFIHLNFSKKEWKEITEEVFQEIFKKSAVKRTKFKGLQRNINFLNKS